MHQDVDNDDHDEADREAADGRGAQCHDALREAGDHLRPGDQEGCAPEEVLHAQRGYEGVGQVEPGQERAVDQADDGAGDQGDQDQDDGIGHAALDQHAAHAGAERRVRADRQVDARRDQAQEHARGQQRREGRLLQDGHDVAVGKEVLARDRQYDAEDYQRAQRTEIGRKAA